MANKRMFSVDVTETDAFYSLPPKAQALYFHLGMRADDDGFVASPVRSCGASKKELKQLEQSGYIILFKSGVLAITDWKVNNTLKNDRYRRTMFQEELSTLKESASKRYVKQPDGLPDSSQTGTSSEPSWNQTGSHLEPQYSIEENSIVEHRKEKDSQAATAAGEPDRIPCDVFSTFSNGDGELLQALRDYDQMRREKRKSLTDTMRRSLCQQLDEEFQPCEWVEIIKQATRQGWLKFYPLDKERPTTTQTTTESGGDQLSRIINNLRQRNGV